ncbi:MAG TPA: pilus assembly protein TadE [Planctomycetaceae bacterium]|nr:pilus assembly protein TadE [Planctomycetaceae bacterium]
MPVRVIPSRPATIAVEFALVAPVIILLFFATVDFVRYNLLRHTASNAAYEAARHVIVPGASRAEAEEKARHVLALLAIQGAQITILPSVITEETSTVQVDIAIPVDNNSWGLAHYFSNQTLLVTSLLRTERAPMVQASSLPEPPPPVAAEPEPTAAPESAPTPSPEPTPTPGPTPTPEPAPAPTPPPPASVGL